MRRTGTTRRGALTATGAAALGAVLAGCGGGREEDSGRSGPATAAEQAAAVRAERRIRTAEARTSLELLGRYERVAAAHPSAAAALAPLRDAVRAHAEALAPAEAGRGTAAPSPSAAPDSARSALKELAAAERRASDARLTALAAAPPELARLLASVAAADAAHAFLLTGIAKEVAA
ncbi:hypothetical protein ACF08W_22765 [Streptomyces sp. NPDC015144]|uniref:hypothetical protein n=1 Tax=Streptomyces sp. NPDC015144 TaxID=3364944 RepID=UPI0036FA2D00